jgi:AcrR family transcriptional regulator
MARSRSSPRKSDRTGSKRTRRYGGQSVKERLAQRRERLVEAGFALFATQGYASTSIELICSKASVTARHFYEQFASREALLLEVYDGVFDRARKAVVTALHRTHAKPRDRVTAGIEAYVHAVLDDPRNARIACVEVVGATPKIERRRRRAIHEIAALIESEAHALADRGSVVRRDFSLTAIAMAGACNELVTDAIMRPTPPPTFAIVDALVGLFLAVIADAEAEVTPIPRRRVTSRRQ